MPAHAESAPIPESLIQARQNLYFRQLESLVYPRPEIGTNGTSNLFPFDTVVIGNETDTLLAIVKKDKTKKRISPDVALSYLDRLYILGEYYVNHVPMDPGTEQWERTKHNVRSFATAANFYARSILFRSPEQPKWEKTRKILGTAIEWSERFQLDKERLKYRLNLTVLEEIRAYQLPYEEAQGIFMEQIDSLHDIHTETSLLRSTKRPDSRDYFALTRSLAENSINRGVYFSALSRGYLYTLPFTPEGSLETQERHAKAFILSLKAAMGSFALSAEYLNSLPNKASMAYKELWAKLHSNMAYSSLLALDYIVAHRPDLQHQIPALLSTFVRQFRTSLETLQEVPPAVFEELKSEIARRSAGFLIVLASMNRRAPTIFQEYCTANNNELVRLLSFLGMDMEQFPCDEASLFSVINSFFDQAELAAGSPDDIPLLKKTGDRMMQLLDLSPPQGAT